jgi:hypothetical protein
MKRNSVLLVALALAGASLAVEAPMAVAKGPTAPTTNQAPASDPWKDYRFFLGKWTGDGLGPAGKGPGTMTVETDLNESILRITNQVDFAGSDKKSTYLGTMIVSKSHKALFLDNEGHVLHYTVTATPTAITFLSVPEPNSPRFRLTYQTQGKGTMKVLFDIAPMETPTDFKIHVSGAVAKK